tara:strand:+ start:3004 stop:5772 length:2769 start_codon:yes stop_codon:yes gene_type:complete
MATPTIPNGDEYFFPISYKGNGTGQKIGKFVPFTDSATINNSCMFNRADNPRLAFTPGSVGNSRTFTFSAWIKRVNLGSARNLLLTVSNTGGTAGDFWYFNTDDTIKLTDATSSHYNLITRREFNNTTKWYHLLIAVDTTQATAANRMKIYIDGDQITSFSTASYPTQNFQFAINYTSYPMNFGGDYGSTGSENAGYYLAEVNMVDGQQLLPASFGETDTSTGRWVPSTVKPYPTTTTDIAVTVVSSGGNKYALDGVTQGTVTLIEGATYKFDQSDSSNSTHPLRFSTTSDGTHNSGTEYTTGVTTVGTPGSSGAYTQITVAVGAPTLYYYCSNHSGMGGTANTQDQYGLSGFRLKFQDSSSLGDDTSGKGNDFTATNLATTDQTTDSPTQNHATFSPALSSSTMGLTEGNLTVTDNGGTSWETAFVGKPVQSGKWYFEATVDVAGTYDTFFGVNTPDALATNRSQYNGYADGSAGFSPTTAGGGDVVYHGNNGSNYYYPGASTSFSNGDIAGIAYDADTGAFWMAKNNTWISSGNPSTGANPLFSGYTAQQLVYFGLSNTSNGTKHSVNFGQRSFAYTPPTDFVALQQDNMPETDKGITGLTWTKDRHVANSWMCIDSSRIYSAEGVFGAMNLNNTNREYGQVDFVDGITKFLKGGHTVMTTNSTYSYMNKLDSSYIDFSWVANSGTKVTNTSGSITSTVQANTTAGFSIVEYVGTGSSGSVGHGLSAAPSWMIIKDRDNDSTNWRVYHKSLGGITKYQILNTNGATQTASMWGTPTASAFIIGGTGYEVNESGRNYVAYCWHEVEGYSKFGKWIGTGLEDGPFIYTGFKPRWLLHKANNAASWYAYDTVRSPNNPILLPVYPDGTYVETPNVYGFDLNSNGFKVRQPTGYGGNYSGVDTYYMAFAEHPFVGDGTNPTTAR